MLSHFLRAAQKANEIQYIASAVTSRTSAGTTIVIAKPTGTVENDLMIAMTCNTGGTYTGPAGWTEVFDSTSRGVFYKVAGASEGSSYTFTNSSSQLQDGFILTFRGATYDTVGAISSSSNPSIAPAITVGANNSYVICFSSSNVTSNNVATFPAGWDVKATDSDSSDPSAAVAIKSFNAGSSGTVSVSFSSASPFTRSMLVSVKPS
jgi:hypothetical protein